MVGSDYVLSSMGLVAVAYEESIAGRPTVMDKWCEHYYRMHKDGSPEFVADSDEETSLCPEANFCPYCGAKRPEKPELLAQRLHDVYIGRMMSTRDKFDFVAKEAIRLVEEVVDKVVDECESVWIANPEDFKHRLREVLLGQKDVD